MNEPLIVPPAPETRVTPPPPPPPGGAPPPAPPSPKRVGAFGRGVWMLIGTVMAIGAVGWGSASAISLVAHEEWDERHTFAANELTAIEIDNVNGRVDVRGADVDEVEVDMRVSRGLRRTGISDEIIDGVLHLRGTCPLIFSEWCSVDYDIVVPRDLAVTIDAANGGVRVTDFDGDLVVDSDNGRIELVAVSGDVTINGDNGRITGTDLGGSVTATSDNGSIELSFATAPDLVVASSDNGSVTVALPRVEGGYDVRTSGDNNADVEVVDDPSSPRMVDLETDNGSITIRDRG